MSRPEDFREEAHHAEGYLADALRGEPGGPTDLPRLIEDRNSTYRDAFRETTAFREMANREPAPREPLYRELGRELGREPGREGLEREGGARPPLSREPAARMTGAPLPGSPLPGSPLPTGTGLPLAQETHKPAPPQGRALSTAAPIQGEDPSTMHRAMALLKHAAPFVARLLPLIDGNVTSAIGNLLANRPHTPPPTVDLVPVHNQLAEMQMQHNDLRGAVQEQTTNLKRVEDQLELVREATDRNTLEQQELLEDLKAMGHKVSMVAVGLSILLVLSVVMNLVLYMYIKRVLP